MIANELVDCDNAEEVGPHIIAKTDRCKFGSIKFVKSQQVKTIAIMRKAVKIGEESICMSSSELYQRLITLAYNKGMPSQDIFSYELSTVAHSIFHDGGTMRKSQKSKLANRMIKMDDDIRVNGIQLEPGDRSAVVIDGCALLHKITWPKVGTFEWLVKLFTMHVFQLKGVAEHVCAVFDSYHTLTTKVPEQKRRRTAIVHPDVRVDMQNQLPANKAAFLSNNSNKQNLIEYLSSHLASNGIAVDHAGEEGDADVIIVKNTLRIAATVNVTTVIADDTDIFVLLIHHFPQDTTIFMKRRNDIVSIRSAKNAIGSDMYVLTLCSCYVRLRYNIFILSYWKRKTVQYFARFKRYERKSTCLWK